MLDFGLKSKGAIYVVGPKQCGKTRTNTVIDLLLNANQKQFTLLAQNSLETIFNQGPRPILIDEFQVINYIFNDIKVYIDNENSFGNFILTGSVSDNISTSSIEIHLGIGRITTKIIRTISLYESLDSLGTVSLQNLKNNRLQTCKCSLG